MSKKYKVWDENNHFLGHYYGKTPEIAINKAIDRYSVLEKNVNNNSCFYYKKNFNSPICSITKEN